MQDPLKRKSRILQRVLDSEASTVRIASGMAHLPRPPSFDHGVISFLWGLGLGFLIWLGLLGVGVSGATSFIIAAVAGAAIFLYVRIYGEEELRR